MKTASKKRLSPQADGEGGRAVQLTDTVPRRYIPQIKGPPLLGAFYFAPKTGYKVGPKKRKAHDKWLCHALLFGGGDENRTRVRKPLPTGISECRPSFTFPVPRAGGQARGPSILIYLIRYEALAYTCSPLK